MSDWLTTAQRLRLICPMRCGCGDACRVVQVGSSAVVPEDELPHELVVTGNWIGGRLHGLRVRCTCMAQLRSPSRRYYAYDSLAVGVSTQEALTVWHAHMNDVERRAKWRRSHCDTSASPEPADAS